MTKRTFIIISIIFFIGMIVFLRALMLEGLTTLALGLACLGVLTWACIKIKFEYEGYAPPKKKDRPQTF